LKSEKDTLLRIEAMMIIALIILAVIATTSYFIGISNKNGAVNTSLKKEIFLIPNLIEAEDLIVKSQSKPFGFGYQSTEFFVTGKWSKNGHMFAFKTSQQDWIDFELPSSETANYEILVFLTKAKDYGVLNFFINGKKADVQSDLYSSEIVSTGPILLGTFPLHRKNNILRLEITGHSVQGNPPYYQFGIDGVQLKKVTTK